ncbi:4-coumarate--CoA ligase-like 9 [Exaiptasia diaphana]|nr:4-coumarate--CoA ligase-like 9 [Exaiptasia diaphana]
MFGQRYSLDTVAALIKIFPKVAIVVLYASSESWLLAKMIVNKETAVEEKYAKLTIEEGVEVKIVDEESKLVSRGTPGEICARKASVFLEYLGNPEATKRTKSSTGWVHMGDTGIMYNDGKIEVIGRKTEIIKRATVKIFPAHIEKVLLQHPQVSDVVVVGIPDQQLHEEVCACVILREDTESDGSDEEAKVLEIREWLNKETAVEEKYAKLTIEEGVEVKIVDEESKLVSRGTPGEICARNASVFLEYLGSPEATKRTKSSTGWVHMGDTGIMYDDGKIEMIGRKTEIIKRATVKIFPAHIEKVLLQHPQVADVVVVGIPDQQLHEEVCACLILREDTESDGWDEEAKVLEIREWCKRQWPPGPDGLSLTPKYFLPMKNFPLLERTGKTFVRGVKDYALKKLNV